MKSARDVGMAFPTTISNDEKRLKESYEKLRSIRKAIIATNKVNAGATVGDNLKTERKTTKKHIQQAEEATEEVKRKVLIGAVSFKKADEKRDSFKRSSLVGRRRDSDKAKVTVGDTANNNSNNELQSPEADDGFNTYKPFTAAEANVGATVAAEASDSFDTYKPAISDFNTSNNSSCPNSANKSSDDFDTYKAPSKSDGFDTYKAPGATVGASDSFDTYKPAGGNDAAGGNDGFDSYKPGQQNSFDTGDSASPFGGSEQPKPCRGPCLYIRGYDLVADSLRNVFSKYGLINRIFVEERQKSAFITYGTTEEAEAAMKEMDGNMVNGITLRVAFARRQNQGGDSGRFHGGGGGGGGRPFDGGGGRGDRGGRFRGERGGRFRGGERGRFRGGRGRGRGRMSEGGDSGWPATSSENKDDFWPDASNKSNDGGWPAAAEGSSFDKDDFWSMSKRTPERTNSSSGWPGAEATDNEGGDGFDTYKPGGTGKDDFDTWKPRESGNRDDGDGFDTWKPSGGGDSGGNKEADDGFNTWSSGRGTHQDNFGDRRGGGSFGERRGGFGERRGGFGGGGGDRRCRRPRRGFGNRGDSKWQLRRRDSEQSGDDYWSSGNDRKRSWPGAEESGGKDDFWPSSGGRSPKARKTEDDDDWPPKRSSRESSPRGKADDKDDFWPAPSRPSRDRDDDPWPSGRGISRGDRRPFRGGRRGDRRGGGWRGGGDRDGRGNGFRRPHRDFDDNEAWPGSRSSKSPPSDAWPDADNRSSADAWPSQASDDVVLSSPPPPPPMSEVQVAWSEATRKTAKEVAEAGTTPETSATQHKPGIRIQVTYDEDDPFA